MAIRKAFWRIVLTVQIVLLTSTGAWSQDRGRGGWGGFGPPSPALSAKFQAWGVWGDTHPDVMTLQQTIASLDDLEHDPKGAMSKHQAKLILAVINIWKIKPSITNTQARRINSALLAPLTFDQFKVMAATQQNPNGIDGRGPGGSGGFGGPPPSFDPASFPNPRDYNPLNPDTIPMPHQRDRVRRHVSQLVSALAATVKSLDSIRCVNR